MFPRIRNEKTAKGAWDILKREFRGNKKVRAVKLQAIKANFEYMRMSENDSLDNYLAKFFEVVNDLKSLGEEVIETRLVQKLLMSLCRRYKSIVSIIEETSDLCCYPILDPLFLCFEKKYIKKDKNPKNILLQGQYLMVN